MRAEKRTPHPGGGAALRNAFTCYWRGYTSGSNSPAQPDLTSPIEAWRRELVRRFVDRHARIRYADGRWFFTGVCCWSPIHERIFVLIQEICSEAAHAAAEADCRRLVTHIGSAATTRKIERLLRDELVWPWAVPWAVAA